MKRCILYYPHIYDISDKWLRQTLLYWDEIGSIVPQSYEEKESYSPDLAYLIGEGEFRPFRTDIVYEKTKSNDFENELIDIVMSKEFQNKIGKESDRFFNMEIYREKVHWDVFSFLRDAGLAKQKNSDWFSFEVYTGLLYMSLLAKYLASEDMKASTICGTDFREYGELNFKAKSNSQIIDGIKLKFFDTLPVPTENVALQDIIEFKRKRRNELLNFRKVLMDIQNKLKDCESVSEANDILTTFEEDMERELSQLKRLLGENKISFVAGTIETISKAKASDWIAGIATQGASLFATFGIGFGKYAIDKRNERSALLSKSAFSYLYSAEKAGFIRN